MIIKRNFETDSQLQSEITKLIVDHKLFPVIGSGFSRNCTALKGTVPSGEDMTGYLRQKVSQNYGCPESKYQNCNFSDLCSMYSKRTPTQEKYLYFKNNFTQVKLPDNKIKFLNLGWQYIYTLNIDDSIEANSNFEIVLPRKEFYEKFISENHIVFKIHGDIHEYLKYIGDEHEAIIFDKRHYYDSLQSNKKMLAKFKDDFAYNNLIYIGCSLREEPDLLSVIRSSISTGFQKRESYFLTDEELDDETLDILEDFGITTCIVVKSYNNFYNFTNDAVANIPGATEDSLHSFREPEIFALSQKATNMDFLLKSDNLIQLPYNNVIFKPYYLINRRVISGVVNDLENCSPIHILYGHRICGKTYCLFLLYNRIVSKERYLFPSGTNITDAMIDMLLVKSNAAVFIDTQCLSVNQMNRLLGSGSVLREQNSFIVFCLNTSDRFSADLLDDNPNYKATLIKNYFDTEELKDINDKLEYCNLPIFKDGVQIDDDVSTRTKIQKFNLLDNFCRISDYFSQSTNDYSIPDISCFDSKEYVAILILLATQQTISSIEMSYFDITKECFEFASKFPKLAQCVYNSRKITRSDAGLLLSSSSRYNLIRLLGNLAGNSKKHPLIVDAYKYLYYEISSAESDDLSKIRKMLEYVKFDIINDIFFRKSNEVITLIYELYQDLEPLMNNSPQFKHQRAKSIFWTYGDVLEKMEEAKQYIDIAYYNTDVLQEQTHNKKLRISFAHISYTKALIYGRICALNNYSDSNFNELTLDAYESALLNHANKSILDYFVELDNSISSKKESSQIVSTDLKNLIRYLNSPDESPKLRNSALELSRKLNIDVSEHR